MPVEIWGPLTLRPVTSDPSDAEEGSLWYRSDLDQIRVSDGQSGRQAIVGPTGNIPIVQSGAWHGLPAFGAPTTMTPTNGRAYALPLWPGRSGRLTGVAAEVTLLGISTLRAGLYRAHPTDNVPDTLVADFGTVATGTDGVKQWSMNQAVRPVLHWLVIVQQGLVTLGLRARDSWDPIVSESTPILNTNRNAYYADGVSGALPSTFPAVAGSAHGPAALVQLA